MAEKLSKEQVEKIATLVSLQLSEKEREKLSWMFADTLEYIDVLEEIDTSEVKETYQVTGLTNVYQKEKQKNQTLTKKEALQNAKEEIKGLFATRAALER